MELLSAVLPIVIILVVSFLIVRIATVILRLTGLDEKTARFQATSAFTGTGFTTNVSETMLEDNTRRKTISTLMIMGKVGIVSVIGGLFFSFGKSGLRADLERGLILLAIIFVLYRITVLKGFSRALNRFIEKRIIARGIVKQRALQELFHLPEGYGIAQLTITEYSKGKGITLAEAGFIDKNILVLSIERKDKLIPFPHANDSIKKNDKLLCYGVLKNIKTYV